MCCAIKSSSPRWHSRLGHPAFIVVEQVLSSNSIPFVPESNKDTMCEAYQKGKSHQLPRPKSKSVSSNPLFVLMYGDQLPPLLARIIFMLASLIILTSSLGFICFTINLRSFKSFMIFRIWLKDFIVRKL